MPGDFRCKVCAFVEIGQEFSFDPQRNSVILSLLKWDNWRGVASCWRLFDHRLEVVKAARGQKRGMANYLILDAIRAPAKVVVTGAGSEKSVALSDSGGAEVEGLLSYHVLDTTGWPNPKPRRDNAWWWERREYPRQGENREMKLIALTGPGHDLVFYLPVGKHVEEPYLHFDSFGYWSRTLEADDPGTRSLPPETT